MANIGTLDTTLRIDTKRAEAQYRRFEQSINKGLGRNNPFARLNNDARDFEKTIGSATNRVVAFGAAAVVFNSLSRAAGAFATSLVEVDKSLAEINVNLGQSAQGLKQFGGELFNVARQTGQTFETAAKAATELARQGLSAEETIKRLKDALILSRISGLDAASSVDTLTAAINSFNKEALTSSEVVNKFAAVDTRFAVSSKDIAEAVKRVGSTAQSAGVGIDQLIGLVTSLQQTTARGGATIGNGLKTIFTRIQAAPETVAALQSVGVAIKDTSGNLRGAIDILRDYGRARERLGEAERSSLDRTVAGTFQINILKAALGDLSKEYSVYDSALRTSVNATDDAIRKNEQLNQTLASLINATGLSIKQLVANVGEADLAPALRGLLQFVETARKYLSGDTGEKAGETIGNGLVKGIANVISGPLLLGLGVVLGKVLIRIGATLKQEASALFQINSASKARAVTQERINFLLKVATQEELAQINTARTVLAQKEALLAVQARYNRELLVGTELQNALIGRGSFGVGKRAGLGKVPGFADPIASAIAKEASVSGLPKSQIYVDRDPRVANFANPAGLLVANRRDEPLGGYQGVNRVISQGGNPKKGSIPGFAKTPLQSQSEIVARRLGIGDIRYDEGIAKTIKAAKAVTSFDAALARSSSIQDQLNNKNIELTRKLSLVNKGFEGLAKEIAAGKPRELNIVGGQSQFATFVPTPSGTIDTSRAIMDRNIARKNAGVEKKVPFGPAFPINPALQSRLEQANLARQGIIPEKAYSSPIGPPSRVEFARAQAIRQAELRQRMSSLVDAANVRKEQAAKTQRETLLAAQEKKSGLRRNIAFGAALALPAAAGFIPEGKGGTAGGIVSGALSGAAQGSTLGIFGPQAAVVGIALGGLAGIISKTTKSFEELSAELGNARAAEKQQTQTLGQLADLQDSIQEAMLSGDRGLASKLSDQVRGILSNKDTPDDVRKTFASLAGDPTKLREAVSKGGSQTTRNEIKDSAILAFKEFSDVGSSLFGTSKDETKDLAKALASQAASIGVGSEGFGVKSVSDFYKLLGTLGVDVPKTASVSLESMLKVTAQAREEYDKNAAAAAAAGKSLKSFELGLIDIGRSVRNASFGDSLSRQSFLGRSERGQIRAKGEIGILSASATTNQAIDLRAVLEQSQLIASNADQNNSLENDLRNVLRTEIGKKPNLSLNERALLGDSGTSTAQLRQLATNANMTGPNSEIGKATEEYNQKLELNTRALNESLLTLKTKTEVEKRETEALRKRLAFSGGSVQRASEEAYGLSRLGRYGERTPSKKIAEDESFVSFFEKQQSLSGNTSSLQGDYEKALSRLNKQKFLTEQASALEGVYGRPLNLRNPDGTVRESGIKYAAEGASRFQDPRKANIGKYVLENLRSQNANITDAGSSQKRINDIINAGKKPALNPEELLSKTTEANLSLQKTLEAFNNASKDFTLTINTNLSVLQDNSTNFDSSEFANLIKGQVETIAGELLSLKGKVNDKPVPPTSVTKSSPNYASPEMRAIYQK